MKRVLGLALALMLAAVFNPNVRGTDAAATELFVAQSCSPISGASPSLSAGEVVTRQLFSSGWISACSTMVGRRGASLVPALILPRPLR
jgi:hypothetical protein